jgi:hypothetical protein
MKRKLIKPAVVALAIVGALLAGGIAYATIPDSSGVIHACYHVNAQGTVDASGALRVIDPSSTNKDGSACKHDEKALDFNQTGPQGAQGPQGPQGPQGSTGPTGPSDVWSVDGFGAQKNLSVSTWVNLATTSLPAGSYFVQAEAEADSTTSIPTEYSCDLVDSSNNQFQATNANSSGDWVTVPVQAVVTLTSADTISLQCLATQPLSEAFNWQLAAIKVGTVHS